jgi:hypothetical protein
LTYGPDDFKLNMRVRINKGRPRKIIGIADDCVYTTSPWAQAGTVTLISDIEKVSYKDIKTKIEILPLKEVL